MIKMMTVAKPHTVSELPETTVILLVNRKVEKACWLLVLKL